MSEKILLNATLLFPVTSEVIYMGVKKKKIGAGLLNGVGGGIEEGEDERTCAIREAEEEWLFTPSALEKVAVMDFHNRTKDGDVFNCRVHVFFSSAWDTLPSESDEMGPPERFMRNDPPLARMMLADRVWLPPILEGKRIVGEAWYGPRQEKLERDVSIHEATPEELKHLRF